MPYKPTHDLDVDLAEWKLASVAPVQQMGRRAQMSTALATRVTALFQMFGKGIKQLDARVIAQTSYLWRPMKEMFKHRASPLESASPMGKAATQIYAQYLASVIPVIPTRKETNYA